jgi:hypothetical protein
MAICKMRPTKRAPDAGDSGAIPSLFLRLSLFPVGRRPAARPSAGNANRWATPCLKTFACFLNIRLCFKLVLRFVFRTFLITKG